MKRRHIPDIQGGAVIIARATVIVKAGIDQESDPSIITLKNTGLEVRKDVVRRENMRIATKNDQLGARDTQSIVTIGTITTRTIPLGKGAGQIGSISQVVKT